MRRREGRHGYNHHSVSDLVIDGQDFTLNFNGLCTGIEMDWVRKIVFKNFNLGSGRRFNSPVWVRFKTSILKQEPWNWYSIPNTTSTKTPSWKPSHPGIGRITIGRSPTLLRTRAFLPEAIRSIWVAGDSRFLIGAFQNGDVVLALYFAGEAAALVINDSFDVDVEHFRSTRTTRRASPARRRTRSNNVQNRYGQSGFDAHTASIQTYPPDNCAISTHLLDRSRSINVICSPQHNHY